MTKPIAICLALGALSLLLPSQLSYDPWAWLVWGREVAHLDLDTEGGPSWKPLPVLVATAFSPLSKLDDGIPPALWLIVARAGGLLALLMAFRLAARLTGGPPAVRYAAAALAPLALLLTPMWVRYMLHGNEAPMAIGLLLWAIDRHLDGRRGHALVLGFLACLLRPEVAPFLGLYGGWVFWREPGLRKLALGLAVALPVLWLVPEWIGSGNPLGAGKKATGDPPWSLALRDKPWLAAFERAHLLIGLGLEIGVVAAVGLAFSERRRARGRASAGDAGERLASANAVLALTGLALLWVLLIVGMTQLGFSGNSRYFLVPLAIACVVGAAGAGGLVQLAPGAPARAAIALVVLVGAGLYVEPRLGRLESQWGSVTRLADLHRDLATAVDRVGGPDAVAAAGDPTINRGFMTHLAWEAKEPIVKVERGRGEGVTFAGTSRQAGDPPRAARRRDLELRFRQGCWRVYVRRNAGVASAPAAQP